MSDDRFGKWWPCLRKHYKRLNIWLPRAKELHEGIDNARPFRYFTLCARPMIDVYMLVKENILPLDHKSNRIQGVSFCECDEKIFPEMIELIGVEESGFLAKLEDLVLFEDIPETNTLFSIDSLTEFLEEEGEGLNADIREKVEKKRQHLLFQRLFPFDFLNLDFCDRYYGNPPDVMKIHGAIDKILDWQRQSGKTTSDEDFSVDKFVVAITCRVDVKTPDRALTRLKQLIKSNRNESMDYQQALIARSITDIDSWVSSNFLDFFMAAWPKEIARLAKQKSWNITIHDHAYYDRQNDEGENYNMVCLVVEFTRADVCNTYLAAVTKCLDESARINIPRFEPSDGNGKSLLSNLRGVVRIRNEQAKNFERDLLPDPFAEITRLRAEGVPI